MEASPTKLQETLVILHRSNAEQLKEIRNRIQEWSGQLFLSRDQARVRDLLLENKSLYAHLNKLEKGFQKTIEKLRNVGGAIDLDNS